MVSGHHGADAAAVAYDAYSSAHSKSCDYLLLDTAGRLHVKDHLMDELSKLKRFCKREPACLQHSWLVIDDQPAQMWSRLLKIFHEKFGLTGLVITKLDMELPKVSPVSIYRELNLPVYFLGLGEQLDDLQPFSISAYLDSLLLNLCKVRNLLHNFTMNPTSSLQVNFGDRLPNHIDLLDLATESVAQSVSNLLAEGRKGTVLIDCTFCDAQPGSCRSVYPYQP